MMPDDKNAYNVPDDAKQKVVREPMEIDAAKISLANRK